MEKSWAKIFADDFSPAIDDERFSALYSYKASSPNTSVNVIIGALIIKVPYEDVKTLHVIITQRDWYIHNATVTGNRINNIIIRFDLTIGRDGSVVKNPKIHAIVEDIFPCGFLINLCLSAVIVGQ